MSTTTTPEAAGARGDVRVISVVSIAHSVSHFFHLVIPPLFPWLKEAFQLSYSELGMLMTVFFVISGVGQSLAGFVVDRVGAVPVMLGALALFALSGVALALAPGYPGLLLGAALAGFGNASFHPVDFSIINRKIATARLGHAYAAHSLAGSLGWALAPVFVVTIAGLAGWREAFAATSLVALVVLVLVWRERATLEPPVHKSATGTVRAADDSTFGFLRLPAVWLSFAFFLAYSVALGGVQSFGPEAARQLHDFPLEWIGLCLTAYMLASAGGIAAGGFLANDPARAERVIAMCFGGAAVVATSIALLPWPGWSVPLLFAVMGVAGGIASPSRDLLIKRATPPGATGRVYGVVYSGLDVGMSLAPLAFGLVMDAHAPGFVGIGIALSQVSLIVGAFRAGRATRVRHGSGRAA